MRICWWMRGSISISEAYYLSLEDRQIINDLVKENLDTAKKSGQPFW